MVQRENLHRNYYYDEIRTEDFMTKPFIAFAFALLAGVVTLTTTLSFAQEGTRCNIKGNVNTRGEKIYHVPGQRYYNQTRISASHGERWFCSEEEARAAGWRKSKV
jgi:hypothetical protein